jgi:thiamine-phosphate pyrophosphorylase
MTEPATAPRLIAITDLSVLAHDAQVERLARLAHAATPGSVALLLRDHSASAKQRLTLGTQLQAVARSSQQELWVADRLDLALLLEADAVHLGEASVSAAAARRLVGSRMKISRAWHAASLEGAAGVDELADVDALLVSPVLAPRKGRPALGLAPLSVLGEQLRARNQACQLYALGGVSSENAAACLAAGAFGVAAIGAVLGDDALALLGALERLR